MHWDAIDITVPCGKITIFHLLSVSHPKSSNYINLDGPCFIAVTLTTKEYLMGHSMGYKCVYIHLDIFFGLKWGKLNDMKIGYVTLRHYVGNVMGYAKGKS